MLIAVGILVILSGIGLAAVQRFVRVTPDVHEQVESGGFQQRHTAVVTATDRSLATFVGASPHGIKLAASIYDRCLGAPHAIGGKSTIQCQRNDIVYMAFDGDSAALQKAWDKASPPTAGKIGSRVVRRARSKFGSDQDGNPSVNVVWKIGPTPPKPFIDFERGIPYQDGKGQLTPEQHPVDVASVYQQAYAHHKYVVEVSVLERY